MSERWVPRGFKVALVLGIAPVVYAVFLLLSAGEASGFVLFWLLTYWSRITGGVWLALTLWWVVWFLWREFGVANARRR